MSDEEGKLEERYRLLWWNWDDHFNTDPDRAIAMIEEAIGIAKTLEEPYWEMEARHWLAQVLVLKKRDFTKGLPLTVQSATEARHPMYKDWTTRICLYQDLIAAYIGVDALTHAEAIEVALDRMQAEAPPSSQCFHCLFGERTSFELNRGNLNAAKLVGQTYLSNANTDYHHSYAQIHLMYIAFLEDDWAAVLRHAEAAEKVSRPHHVNNLVKALVWQAVAHLKLGDIEKGHSLFLQSEAERELCGVTFGMQYWTGRVMYYEFSGDLDAAITARQTHLNTIAGLGALREEAEAWLDLCRLQKQQGDIHLETLEQTRTAIERLQTKGGLPGRLEQLLH